jgi:hypothetical protein
VNVLKILVGTLPVLGIAIIAGGCLSVRDLRGPSDICEVHLRTMKSEIIREIGGTCESVGYHKVRAKLFPHDYPQSWPDPRPWRLRRIYVCEGCVKAEWEWLDDRRRRMGGQPVAHFR